MQILLFMRPTSMCKRILTAVLFLITIGLYAQAQSTTSTLYAYRQRVNPGTQKIGEVDENGRVTKKEMVPVFHYTVYFTTATKSRIYPMVLWINGEAATVETETLVNPPSLPSNVMAPAALAKPLFPKPAGFIYKLIPRQPATGKRTSTGKMLAKENAVVLLYNKDGKLQYGVLKKFTDLTPVSLQ
jgi:hypothetical protein